MSQKHTATESELGLSESLTSQQKVELEERLIALGRIGSESKSLREKLQGLESQSKVADLVLISQICTSLSLHPPQTQLLDAALGLE